MKEVPDEITVCRLQVVLMPNGEIICNGKTIGWADELLEFLQKEVTPKNI